jgi:tetratricopeptide (TPR) repeat protein
MFCPKCKAEYRPGYTVCADCEVPLVEQLPVEPEPEEPEDAMPFPPGTELVHILDTFNPGDTALIKSILDAEGIRYWLEGDYSAQYIYHSIPTRLMVPSDQAEKAREALKQLDLSLGQVTLTDTQFDENHDDDRDNGQGDETSQADTVSRKRPIGLSTRRVQIIVLIAFACLVSVLYLIRTNAPDDRSAKAAKARAYYKKAMKLNPESDYYRYEVGVTYEAEGDLKEALRYYDQAIELNPKNTDAYHRRAYVYLKLRDYNRALQEIDKAIDLSPREAAAHILRGIIHARLRNYEQAIVDYDQAIALNPSFSLAYVNRGLAREALGKHDEALKDFSKIIESEPKQAQDYLSHGFAHYGLGKYRDAVEDLDRVLSSNPEDREAYSRRGWSYLALEDYGGALADCGKAIGLEQRYFEDYGCRGRANEGSGDCGKAIKDYKKAIELEPDQPAGYVWMAWALGTCGEQRYRDGQEALRYAQEAVAREEKAKDAYLPEYYDALAAAYAESGDFDKAAQTELKAYDLYRPLDVRIKNKDDVKELIEAYKSRQTYVQWKSKKSKN